MFDFRDVAVATKDEQIRAWALEQAINIYGASSTGNSKGVLADAAAIEKFIKEGKQEDG
jgi:hypothetical protein